MNLAAVSLLVVMTQPMTCEQLTSVVDIAVQQGEKDFEVASLSRANHYWLDLASWYLHAMPEISDEAPHWIRFVCERARGPLSLSNPEVFF